MLGNFPLFCLDSFKTILATKRPSNCSSTLCWMLKTSELTISFVKEEHIFSSILSFSIVGVQYRFRARRFSVLVDIEAPFKTILELTEWNRRKSSKVNPIGKRHIGAGLFKALYKFMGKEL